MKKQYFCEKHLFRNLLFQVSSSFRGLVSATHPRYKLAPSVDWLPGVHAERLRYRTKEYLINIIKESEPEEFENNEAGHQIETNDLEDEFISTLLEFPDKKSGVNQTKQFLRESSPLKHFDLSAFSNDTIKDLFTKFNTPIPSSAAVERLFSTGKDVLKPKRSRLTDKHFKMLLFLRKNK